MVGLHKLVWAPENISFCTSLTLTWWSGGPTAAAFFPCSVHTVAPVALRPRAVIYDSFLLQKLTQFNPSSNTLTDVQYSQADDISVGHTQIKYGTHHAVANLFAHLRTVVVREKVHDQPHHGHLLGHHVYAVHPYINADPPVWRGHNQRYLSGTRTR